MNSALIHLGYKGGTFHYSKAHIPYLKPKLLVCSKDIKIEDYKEIRTSKLQKIKTYKKISSLLFLSLFLPFEIITFLLNCYKNSIRTVFVLDMHPWSCMFSLASRIFGMKVLVVVHDGINANKNRFGEISLLLQKISIYSASHLFFLSEKVQKDTLKKLNLRDRIPTSFFPLPPWDFVKSRNCMKNIEIDNQIPRFLFFGTLNKSKGYNAIFNSFSKLIKSKERDLQKWELKVCGKENSKVDKIKDLRISYNLTFIPDEEISDLFNNSNIILLPYTKASQSGVLVLAAQFNLYPVISNIPSLIEQAQFYFEEYSIVGPDSNSLFNKISEIIKSFYNGKPFLTKCSLPTIEESAKSMKKLING